MSLNESGKGRSAGKAAYFALGSTLAGLLFLVLFFATDWGAVPLAVTAGIGLLGAALAVIALVKKQPKGIAVTALVLSTFMFLLAGAIFLFALIFVGYFG